MKRNPESHKKNDGVILDMNVFQFVITVCLFFAIFIIPTYIYSNISQKVTPQIAGVNTDTEAKTYGDFLSNIENFYHSLTKTKYSSLTLISFIVLTIIIVLFFVSLHRFYREMKYLRMLREKRG